MSIRMNEDDQRKWSSYSDYEKVVESVADRVERAIDAFGHLNACQSQRIAVSDGSAVGTKKALIGVGVRLKPEVRMNRHVEPFDDVWDRWEGEDGMVSDLYDADFVEDVPSWLPQYIEDVTTVAWELGYIKAGREEPSDPDEDEVAARELIQ